MEVGPSADRQAPTLRDHLSLTLSYNPVIYTAETFAGAILEILAHSNLGRIPTTHSVIEVKIPTTCRGNRSMRRKCWDGMQRIKLQAAHAATTG